MTPMHEDPVQAVAIHGGNCAPVIRLFTGHAAESKKPKEIANELRHRLDKSFQEHRIVVVGVPGHAMACVNYDRQADDLTIWNPWGTDGKYGELGVQMQHGFFRMPVSEFINKCTNVMFELAENAEPESKQSKKKRQRT